jgi:hypothetical protein
MSQESGRGMNNVMNRRRIIIMFAYIGGYWQSYLEVRPRPLANSPVAETGDIRHQSSVIGLSP